MASPYDYTKVVINVESEQKAMLEQIVYLNQPNPITLDKVDLNKLITSISMFP